jgi:flagellar hook protein FlgE
MAADSLFDGVAGLNGFQAEHGRDADVFEQSDIPIASELTRVLPAQRSIQAKAESTTTADHQVMTVIQFKQ